MGESHDLVEKAIEYLLSEQDQQTRSWAPGVFFLGRLDNGTEPVWVSAPLTSAIALEALCRYQLAESNGESHSE